MNFTNLELVSTLEILNIFIGTGVLPMFNQSVRKLWTPMLIFNFNSEKFCSSQWNKMQRKLMDQCKNIT